MKAPCKNTWTGVRWLLLARGACGSGRLWGACAQSDGGLALSRRGHVHPRSGFGHGRLCSNAYPPSGFPLGVFLWPSSLVFLFIPLAAFVSSFCVIVFVCATLFRGRRQLPQAGEVRRPLARQGAQVAILCGVLVRSDVRSVTPSNGLAWSAMLDNAYPLERSGGGLFCRRGVIRGRAGALRNQ